MTARVAPRGHDPRPPVPSRPVPSRQRPRAGFTLIELMIVIVIIILLIALLVPAIGGALRNAREGQVKQEIGQFEYAIADFKAHYGMNPPSYIDLRLNTATPPQLPPRTVALLRRLWPNINLTDPSAAIPTGMRRVLEGDQCLVFFLGGMYDPTTEAFVGFSVNPRSPFLTTGKRVGPFFEFQKSRLVADTATGGIIGYLDPLPDQKVPYYYVTNDRYAQYPPATPPTLPPTWGTLLPPKIVYFQDAANKSAYNAQSFQIISAGPDGATLFDPDGAGTLRASEKPVATPDHASYKAGYWGVGGHFDPKKTNLATALSVDADNITNFHGGRLYP